MLRPLTAAGRRSILAPIALGALLTLAAILLAASSTGEAVAAGDPMAKVERTVLDQLASNDEVTFWVLLREQADVSPARRIENNGRRGRFVVDELKSLADGSQKELRKLLRARGATHKPFWLVNGIQVTGGRALLEQLVQRSEVASVIADRTYEIPRPAPAAETTGTDGVEWGIERIRAPLAWSSFNARGQGIVVANIDTGVRYDHPALVAKYRGNQGGAFSHDYNWFDATKVCGDPSALPCDNSGHGTHTMGTMVGGGEAGSSQIGVAPDARWIAAKGCASGSCASATVLSAGQWILAPTDRNGQNPRPDLRPHIVNNSWGNGNGGNTFYQATVRAWVASGIMPIFANGNAGPTCGTGTSPATYPESYGVGAFGSDNVIASFSSRGAAPAAVGGGIKPDIAAPGVGIRSAWNDGGYRSGSGTSMAAPHVAGTVALLWSHAPWLARDIAATRALLDRTAIDTSDLTCGGTPADNSVWGEGRLDAFEVVRSAVVAADSSAPTTTIAVSPQTPNGANGWYVSKVHPTVSADGASETRCVLDPATTPSTFDDLPAGCAYTGSGADVATDGQHTLYAASRDAAGNRETPRAASFKIDQAVPTVTCGAMPTFLLGAAGALVPATVTDSTSGPAASTVSAPANVSSAGKKSVVVGGSDNAGNSASATCNYVVAYNVLGFSPAPGSSYPQRSTIPVTFGLANAAGTRISDLDALGLALNCKATVRLDDRAGSCASYTATTGTFQANVKTTSSTALGTHTITLEVYVGADRVNTRAVQVVVREPATGGTRGGPNR